MKLLALPVIVMMLTLVVSCDNAPALSEKAIGSYDKDCAVPLKGWLTSKDGIGHLRVIFPVILDEAGNVVWNGEVASDEKLREYMQLWSGLTPQPQIILEVSSNAPCHRVKVVRDIMDSAPICRGEYSYCSEGRNWNEWEEVGGP